MKLPATVAALSLTVLSTAHPQTAHLFTDPANLRGERVSPRTGLELPVDQGASGLQQTLRKLNTRASLMLIVAHPDDEDGGMLTFYSRGQGARVATLTLTRGEGGQNAMTGDFEDALGLIRTQELLAADRYMGVDQMFGTEVDFGFSKTKEEAFSKWTHQRVLYDAVRAVRLYRPLVLAAVFTGGVTDGHGQHQVSGEIAQEVFKAAGDPTVFPELTREGILPWQPLKVYARVPSFAITDKGLFDYATNQFTEPHFTNYVTGQTTTTPPAADVLIHEGQVDPLLTNAGANAADLSGSHADPTAQLSFVQFARIGLGLQRTQIGPGVRLAGAGAYDVSYHRYGSRLARQAEHEDSFFGGIDTSVRGIASLSSAPPPSLVQGLSHLGEALEAVSHAFNAQHPEASAPALVDAQHRLGALLYSLEEAKFPGKADVLHELRVKQVQLNDAINLALGLQFSANADAPGADVPQGSSVKVHTTLTSSAPDAVGVFSEAVAGPDKAPVETLLAADKEPVLRPSQPFGQTLEAPPSLTATPTRPYFSRDSIEQPFYTLNTPALRNAPATPAPLTAWATLRYHETEVRIGRVVAVGKQQLAVAPPASIALPAHAEVFTPAETTEIVPVLVRPPDIAVKGEVATGWTVRAEDSNSGAKQLIVKPATAKPAPATLQALAALPGGKEEREGYRAVGYAGLPRTNFYSPARLKIVPVDLKLPEHRRIGYLPGTGDAVADILASIGFPVTKLSVSDLTPARLSAFDTVVLGVRTYNAHPDLHGAATEALLAFARTGGNVVLQYQTAEFTGADAPYPLELGNAEKVVDENAPVQLLSSGSSGPEDTKAYTALLHPNHLTRTDWSGWVEERGHGFLHDWDPHYTALTETHDPGAAAEHIQPQVPQRGGWVTTPLGKGHWTYCAFALYRQLPEAVPGAFRIFVNILGLADQPAR